eukprot:4023518-Amphidinium_carterae.1
MPKLIRKRTANVEKATFKTSVDCFSNAIDGLLKFKGFGGSEAKRSKATHPLVLPFPFHGFGFARQRTALHIGHDGFLQSYVKGANPPNRQLNSKSLSNMSTTANPEI